MAALRVGGTRAFKSLLVGQSWLVVKKSFIKSYCIRKDYSLRMTFTADGKRQTADYPSVLFFFSCIPRINHTKNKKNVSYYSPNTNIALLYRQPPTQTSKNVKEEDCVLDEPQLRGKLLYRKLKTDSKSFNLPFDVTHGHAL